MNFWIIIILWSFSLTALAQQCMDAPAAPEADTSQRIVNVANTAQLQQAMDSLRDNTVLLLRPGTYQLDNTLWVNRNNVTISGDSNRCDEVVLQGRGMENAAGAISVPHGVWTDKADLKIQNLTISDVYRHGIIINGGAQSPHIYNVRLLNTGEQFIKVNALGFASGVNDGKVEYSVMAYTSGPPVTDHGGGTGYTNGVDVHAGNDWIIRHNRFENFHTPDSAQNLWNPAILMWNGASGTLAENNVFINVDRAIAFGLVSRGNDHSGGIIRNNMIFMSAGLYSASRKAQSDAAIIIWDSPNTQVLHNTVLSQGNLNKAIELRFDSNGTQVRNNLVDARVSDRSGMDWQQSDNVQYQGQAIFRDPVNGDLRLIAGAQGITQAVPVLSNAASDIDGHLRGSSSSLTDAGADELGNSGGGVCRAATH